MATNKTGPTQASVDAFIAAVPDAARRADAEALLAMMHRASGEEPYMYGGAIVGFGVQPYRYESGRNGEMPRISFSPRKAALVIYGLGRFVRDGRVEALGDVTTGKGCVYVKRLAAVDRIELERLLAEAAGDPSPA
jgi:hypothetical protein